MLAGLELILEVKKLIFKAPSSPSHSMTLSMRGDLLVLSSFLMRGSRRVSAHPFFLLPRARTGPAAIAGSCLWTSKGAELNARGWSLPSWELLGFSASWRQVLFPGSTASYPCPWWPHTGHSWESLWGSLPCKHVLQAFLVTA